MRPFYECKCKSGFEPLYNNSANPRALVNCTGKHFVSSVKNEEEKGERKGFFPSHDLSWGIGLGANRSHRKWGLFRMIYFLAHIMNERMNDE